MKTGPHSFRDPTGVEWFIEGYSRACGPAYVDCRSADGKALTVRPIAYLAPAGLSLPDGCEPPKRKATDSEQKAAHEQAERIVGAPIDKPKRAPKAKAERKRCKNCRKNPGIEQFPDGSNFNADGLCPTCAPIPGQLGQVIQFPVPPREGAAALAYELHVAQEEGTGSEPAPVEPPPAEPRGFVAGRYVLHEPHPNGEDAYVTSWDTWPEAHAAFPIPDGLVLTDDATGEEWRGPLDCECGNCFHRRFGCLACGDKTGTCTPTECKKPSESVNPPDGGSVTTRVVNKHREGWDVDIGRPGPWGNPYSHLPDSAAQHIVETRERAIDLYREWLRQRVRDGEPGLVQALASLHGLRLGCYCAPEPCHGDVLVEAAAWAAQAIGRIAQT